MRLVDEIACDAALMAAVPPAVVSKKACSGKPVGDGVCVCDDVALSVCVSLGVPLGVWVCEDVWLGVALVVGVTLGLRVREGLCVRLIVPVSLWERLCVGLAGWLRVKDALGEPESDGVPDGLGLPVDVCE